MQTSTKWIIGLAVVGAGIYFATKGPNVKPVTEEEIVIARREASLATNEQVIKSLQGGKNILRMITEEHSKLISKYGEEGYGHMFARITTLIAIYEQELARRNLRIS